MRTRFVNQACPCLKELEALLSMKSVQRYILFFVVCFMFSIFSACSSNNGTTSNSAKDSINEISGNLPPNANGTTVTAQKDGSVDVDINTLASDPDGDNLDLTTIDITNIVGGSTLTDTSTGVVTFTPTPGSTATGSFDYTIADNNASPKTSTPAATVTVNVNVPPVAGAGNLVVPVGGNNSIDLKTLMTDSDNSGIDWPTLVINNIGSATATVTHEGNGVVSYVDNDGVSTSDSFDYTVVDLDSGTSNPATITVRVNEAPLATSQAVSVKPSATIVITLDVSDSDGTLDCASLVITPGTVTPDTSVNDCTVSYTAGGIDATDSFSYTVNDNDGTTSNSAMVTVTVSELPLPNEVDLEEPTLHSLGVRWLIEGENSADTTIEVNYRKVGETNWVTGMPLFRVESEALADMDPLTSNQTLFAGSLFYLTPGTEYEVILRRIESNGDSTDYTFTQNTRSEPIAPGPLRTFHVIPGSGGGSGSEGDPFQGFYAADQVAEPGDLFLIHGGTYTGPVTLTQDGTSEAPIVWRGAEDGDAIIQDPDGNVGIRVNGRRYLYLEKLTVQNVRWGIRVIGASDLVIRRCHFKNANTGIFGDGGGQERLFISDNILDGGVNWPEPADGEYRGIELAGIGHIIAYNEIKNYRDGVDTRLPWPTRGIDIHNNEISECRDDGIELDFSQHNVRAYRNRITNVSTGISFQPSRGGPNYALHNSIYNVGHETFKLHITSADRTSGGVLLHNTVVKKDVAFRVWSNEGPAHYFTAKNNLMIGSPAQYAIELTPLYMLYADFDYNAWAQTSSFAYWNGRSYSTLTAFQNATGLEEHSLIVNDISKVFSGSIAIPEDTLIKYPLMDLRLGSGSPVVDKGVSLPGINDGFSGFAPDIGAYEAGQELPHYGPRP